MVNHATEYNESMKNNKVDFQILICKISKIYLEGYTKTVSTDWQCREEVGE